MVRLNAPAAVAPVASFTVIDALLNVPAMVEVPVTSTYAPEMLALRPGGRFDCAMTVNDPVPPLIGMAPV